MHDLDARGAALIRAYALQLSAEPMDMCAGTNTASGRVVAVFGAAHPHHAYVFTNRRGDQLKVLVHDGIGIWLCARRLHQGGFIRASLMKGADSGAVRRTGPRPALAAYR